MIKKIVCLSRADANRIKSAILGNTYLIYDNVFCISINGTVGHDGAIDGAAVFTPEEVASSWHEEHMQNRVLAMEFDDIEPASIKRFLSCANDKAMTISQAEEIIRYIRYWGKLPGDNVLIIHCKAGLCRTGAIARFAAWFLDREVELHVDNPQIHNNNWVYNLLYYAYKQLTDVT